MYKQWLHFTCKWTLLGLDGDEFNAWQELTTKLNKHCPDCEEGYICKSCKNTGLNLDIVEKMILNSIEMSLNVNQVNQAH